MQAEPWTLDGRLAADSALLRDEELLQVRAVLSAPWPWLILVPKAPGASEWHDLPSAQAHALLDRALLLGPRLKAAFAGDKLNLAALGNQVAQLHLHLVLRHQGDPGWPGPIWGQPWSPLSAAEQERRRRLLESVVNT